MFWIGSDEDQPVIKEIVRQRDRTAAIVSAAYLEKRLEETIKLAMLEPSNALLKDTAKKLFKPSGPLGSFGAKIDIGLMLGIYGDGEHKTMSRIALIRNEFAHKPHPTTFASKDIKHHCDKLVRPIRHRVRLAPEDFRIFSQGEGNADKIMAAMMYGRNTPRDRYMVTFKILLFQLWIRGLMAKRPETPRS